MCQSPPESSNEHALEKMSHKTGLEQRLEHLTIPHLDGKEDHCDRGEPNATSTKPENTRALRGNQILSSEGRNNTGNTTQAR